MNTVSISHGTLKKNVTIHFTVTRTALLGRGCNIPLVVGNFFPLQNPKFSCALLEEASATPPT